MLDVPEDEAVRVAHAALPELVDQFSPGGSATAAGTSLTDNPVLTIATAHGTGVELPTQALPRGVQHVATD